jgi:hypothetical protein
MDVGGASCWTISAHVPLSPASGLSYQGFITIDPIANNNLSFDAMGLGGSGLIYDKIWPAANQTTSQRVLQVVPLGRYILIQIVASTVPATDTLLVSFLQT